MIKLTSWLCLVVGLLMGCAGEETVEKRDPSAEKKDIPLREFFKTPERMFYEISPDGTHLAYLAPFENRLNLFVQTLSFTTGKPAFGDAVRLTNFKERSLSDFMWKGNHSLVFLKDKDGDENFHVYTVNIETKEISDRTPYANVRAEIVDRLEGHSETDILVTMNRRNPQAADVFRLNVHTGKLKLLAENPGTIQQWVADNKGVVRLAVALDGPITKWLYRENPSKPFTTVLKYDFREKITPSFFTFDNKNVYAVSDRNRDKQAAVMIDPRSGKELELIYENPDADITSLYRSKFRKVLVAAEFEIAKPEIKFLDAKEADINQKIKAKIPEMIIETISETRNENFRTVRARSDWERGDFFLYDVKRDALTEIAKSAPWLGGKTLAEQKPISFQSRDGLLLHGYLTLPPGKEAKNLPIVLHPHGGPWSRDSWGFDPTVQFLASRGYGVLQINFRGSTGFGRKFWEASFKQWGRKMQDDLTDGVNWVIAQGVADPKRVAIFGASYGGYATLAGLAFTPDLYACGIDYVGISNIFTFYKSFPPYWKPQLEASYIMVGDPEKEADLVRAASPLFSADKIRVPLLVAQGAQDPRVKKAESDQMVESLRKRGMKVEYIVKQNEGHGFSNEENRFELFEAIEKFLASCIGKK